MRWILLLTALSGTAACATGQQYFFKPAEQATATVAGHPAARYGIPPESPRGSVRVASFGITTVETSEGDVPTLHVRLTAANNNDTGPWEIDARDFRVAYGEHELAEPAFVHTGSAEGPVQGARGHVRKGPVVSIEPGEKVDVDTYFPLPQGAEDARHIPELDLLWEVSTPERVVAERTPFERVRVEPPEQTTVMYGLGATWWNNPYFLPGRPLIVVPAPRR